MFRPSAPGVYYQRLDAVTPVPAGVRTDVAGFVGLAERGPVATPVPIESWRQFEGHFGGLVAGAYLAYAVRAFFENGGRRCWVVRATALDEASQAGALLLAEGGEPGWIAEASSPGTWGDQLAVSLLPARSAEATTVPAGSTPEYATVSSLAGFERHTLVRISQPGLAPLHRVVAAVDVARRRLYWVAPDASAASPHEAPLLAGDPSRPFALASVEHELVVFERGREVARFRRLSPVRGHSLFGPDLVRAPDIPRPNDPAGPVPTAAPPVVLRLAAPDAHQPAPLARVERVPLTGGRDGLTSLRPEDLIGEPSAPLDPPMVQRRARRGIAALAEVGEVAIVAVPDVHARPEPAPRFEPPADPFDPCPRCPRPFDPPAPPLPSRQPESPPGFTDAEIARVLDALLRHCEARGDRFALLDPPRDASHDRDAAVPVLRAFRSRFDSTYGALYFPWLEVVDPVAPARLRSIPPSGHVAGQFARTDLEVGVHRAAANRALDWTQAVSLEVGDEVHGLLNDEGVDVVRTVPGRGARVMGARTLSSDPSWRYVPVRRLLLAIRKTIAAAVEWAVFEPNDDATRGKLFAVLDGYLRGLWGRGALAGADPSGAFFVEVTAGPEDRAEGRLLARVGVAPVVPFEFVLLRVGRAAGEVEVSEDDRLRGVA